MNIKLFYLTIHHPHFQFTWTTTLPTPHMTHVHKHYHQRIMTEHLSIPPATSHRSTSLLFTGNKNNTMATSTHFYSTGMTSSNGRSPSIKWHNCIASIPRSIHLILQPTRLPILLPLLICGITCIMSSSTVLMTTWASISFSITPTRRILILLLNLGIGNSHVSISSETISDQWSIDQSNHQSSKSINAHNNYNLINVINVFAMLSSCNYL